jgi:hypothetical protein
MKIVSVITLGVSVACVSSGVLNGMLLKHVDDMNFRIYCVAKSGGNSEQMRCEEAVAAAKLGELIHSGASPDECNESGVTPLMVAARGGLGSFVDVLLGAGAKADTADKDGFTALDYAIIGMSTVANIPAEHITLEFRSSGRSQSIELLVCRLLSKETELGECIISSIGRLKKSALTKDDKKLAIRLLTHYGSRIFAGDLK